MLASSLFNGVEGIETGGMEGIETGGTSEDQGKMSGRGAVFGSDSKVKVSRYGRVLKKKA